MASAEVDSSKIASDARHPSSAAKPDDSLQNQDRFSNSVAGLLNARVLDGKIKSLLIVVAPQTLGEMRKS